MTGHFEEERFFLGEKSNRMVTVTPFMGKINVYILQFYVNGMEFISFSSKPQTFLCVFTLHLQENDQKR